MNDFKIVLQDLPLSVKGFIKEDEDGYGTVIVNSKYDEATRMKAAQHEIAHHKRNDYAQDDVQRIEREAHK